MSSEATPPTPPPAPSATPIPAAPPPSGPKEITIVSHSNLFYWWPVWAVGFLMALLTYWDGHRMALVPDKTTVETGKAIDGFGEPRDVLVAPAKTHLPKDDEGNPAAPKVHMAAQKSFGVIWAITLLLVIIITNVPLRGMWSVIVIIVIVMLSIIFALAGWWDKIFNILDLLRIHVNAGGYLFISTALFIMWLVTLLFFDHQMYISFSPGSMKVCTEIGGGEKAYDTIGMTIEKQRSDLFRHWILGLGSGDLIVNTAGAHVHHFDLQNVLFVSRKVQMIEDLMREKEVVRGR